MSNHRVSPLLPLLAQFCLSASFGATAPTALPADEIGRAVYVGDDLLRDYQPRPTLVTRVSPKPTPRFPVIDIHCHWLLQQDPQLLLKAMDELGVRKAVNLSGGYGPALDHMLARYHKID